MAETVRLTVRTGPHKGKRFCFCGPAVCKVGRAPDCFVRFSGEDRDLSISRYHCRLRVEPPAARVQDLGSLNGTYINGQATDATTAGRELRSGDIVTIGGTSFIVDVVDCPDFTSQGPVWQEGEVAKEDCPNTCPADGSMPFVGCCVGGFAANRVRAM